MKIFIKSLQKKIPINPRQIRRAVLKVFSFENITQPAQISVCFVDDKRIRYYNRRYCKKDEVTDVLAFDLSCAFMGNYLVADILISVDAARRNAKIYNTSPLYELLLYVIHAVLHLLGYKDRSFKQAKMMQEKAEKILSCLKF